MNKRGCIVRGLWGEAGVPGYETTLTAIRDTMAEPTFTNEENHLRVFAYGLTNADFLAKRGLPWCCLNKEPLVNWSGAAERNTSEDGRVHWGVSHWRHKLEIIRAALAWYPQVLWLDWDCRVVEQLPEDFWARLAGGEPYRASLRKYANPQAYGRVDRVAKRLVPHGAWQYFRRDWIAGVISSHAEVCPEGTDESGAAAFFDRMHDGWIGVNRWAELYEPDSYHQGKSYRQVIAPRGSVLFHNVGIY